jgi:transposase
MPTKRLSMRRIHRLMTLRFGAGAATRAISRELGISHSTVREYLARIAAAGIPWPLPAEVTDQELERRLFVNGGVRAGARHYVEPDWAAVARELKRPGVNLMILWEEYRAVHPDGYAYSRYCQLFREFERRLSPSMRQTHVAGDKAFVDFSGKKIPIIDAATGVVREAEIFVAVLGASNLTYAEATWSQGLPDWIGAHVRMFRFWGSRPRLLVCDYVPGNKIRHDLPRDASEAGERAHVASDPVRQRLRPACLGIREIGGAERCHEDLCPPHLASGAVDDLNGLPGVVDEQPLARRMGLAHRRRQAAAPGGI